MADANVNAESGKRGKGGLRAGGIYSLLGKYLQINASSELMPRASSQREIYTAIYILINFLLLHYEFPSVSVFLLVVFRFCFRFLIKLECERVFASVDSTVCHTHPLAPLATRSLLARRSSWSDGARLATFAPLSGWTCKWENVWLLYDRFQCEQDNIHHAQREVHRGVGWEQFEKYNVQ